MIPDSNLQITLLTFFGFLILLVAMAGLVRWARSRSTGVLAVGAFLSVFSPDPTFEQKIKLVEEAREIQSEEDGQGEL